MKRILILFAVAILIAGCQQICSYAPVPGVCAASPTLTPTDTPTPTMQATASATGTTTVTPSPNGTMAPTSSPTSTSGLRTK
jgi:hypothetical protein